MNGYQKQNNNTGPLINFVMRVTPFKTVSAANSVLYVVAAFFIGATLWTIASTFFMEEEFVVTNFISEPPTNHPSYEL